MDQPPELVIDAPPPRWLFAAIGAGALAVLLGVPAVVRFSPAFAALGGSGGICLMSGVGAAMGFSTLLVDRWYSARFGRVEVRSTGVCVSRLIRARRPVEVPWTELLGYRDASSDHVVLVQETQVGAHPLLRLPTPTSEVRAALLALLDRRGLRRLD